MTHRSWPAVPLRLVPLRGLSDERLAQLISTGDPDAFGVLYQRYRGPLSRYCRSIVREAEDAGDAVQSAMLAALRSLRSGVPSGALRPWLYRIAHNESVSVLRRRRPHEQLSEETPARERDTVARERWESVVNDLQTLPERQRGALVMRELGGLSYVEIGGALEISAANARHATFEARTALSDLAEGRERGCAEIRLAISDGDRRTLRARRVRGHVQACAPCASFERSLRERRRALGLIPALPGISVGGLLATGGAAVPGAGAALIGGGSVAAKGIALGGALALAGAGAIVVGGLATPAPHRPPRSVVTAPPRGPAPRSSSPAHPLLVAGLGARAPVRSPASRSAAPTLPSAPRPVPATPPLTRATGGLRLTHHRPPSPGQRRPPSLPPSSGTGGLTPGVTPAAPTPVSVPSPAVPSSPAVTATAASAWLSTPIGQRALAMARAYGGASGEQGCWSHCNRRGCRGPGARGRWPRYRT